MQQIHLIAIKYLTLFMLNKCKLENHHQPIPPTKQTPKLHTQQQQPQDRVLQRDA
jgi:hypothetical protein